MVYCIVQQSAAKSGFVQEMRTHNFGRMGCAFLRSVAYKYTIRLAVDTNPLANVIILYSIAVYHAPNTCSRKLFLRPFWRGVLFPVIPAARHLSTVSNPHLVAVPHRTADRTPRLTRHRSRALYAASVIPHRCQYASALVDL
jgi:hypothetical protein